MQTVEIVDHEMILTEFHCPFCGASTLSKGSVESCQHLIYVTHDETFDGNHVRNTQRILSVRLGDRPCMTSK